MLFLGDIAIPDSVKPSIDTFKSISSNPFSFANFEGAYVDDGTPLLEDRKLFNASSVWELVEKCHIKAVSLANNHIFDVNQPLSLTTDALRSKSVESVGAGENLEVAAKPLLLEVDGQSIAILAFGWHLIECIPAKKSEFGVNPLEPKHVLNSVKRVREQYPDRKLIAFMHWDYEMELYPMPMQRELAKQMIDAGASGIVGCHAHCVQGIELYNSCPIVYGLGNWFLAENVFFSGRLKFPEITKTTLAFEWDLSSNEMHCHWYQFDPVKQCLNYRETEKLEDSKTIEELTPYQGMEHRDYINWFKQHRRKKKLLPIYRHVDSTIMNHLLDIWVRVRQHLVYSLFKCGLKQGPR